MEYGGSFGEGGCLIFFKGTEDGIFGSQIPISLLMY